MVRNLPAFETTFTICLKTADVAQKTMQALL